MILLKDAIQKFYPNQTIQNSYLVRLEEFSRNSGILQLCHFKATSTVDSSLSIIETDSYWFVDRRLKLKNGTQYILFSAEYTTGTAPSIQVATLFLMSIFVVIATFHLIDLWSLILGLLTFLFYATYLLFQKKAYDDGMLVEVYKKDWVKVNKNNEKLVLSATVPAKSITTIWKSKIRSSILMELLHLGKSLPYVDTYEFTLLN